MEPKEKKKRPKWVWAITIYFFVSAGWTLLSFYLIGSGVIPLKPEQQAYFNALSTFDYAVTILAELANISGAVTIFLLRKMAFYLFTGALIANSLLLVWHVLSKGWVAAIGSDVLIGAMIGWGLVIAVCFYTWNLTKKGVLT